MKALATPTAFHADQLVCNLDEYSREIRLPLALETNNLIKLSLRVYLKSICKLIRSYPDKYPA